MSRLTGPDVRKRLPSPLSRYVAELPAHSWKIGPELAAEIAGEILLGGRRNVLEFGAGASSVVAAMALSEVGGGRLTSIEQDPDWCRAEWEHVQAHGEVEARLVESEYALGFDRRGFRMEPAISVNEISGRGPFDLVVIDAPQYWFGRGGVLPWCLNLIVERGRVLVDDYARVGEQRNVTHWLACHPGLRVLRLEEEEGRGIALLEVSGDRSVRFSAGPFLSSSIWAARLWRARRVRERRLRRSSSPA